MQITKKPASPELEAADQALRRAVEKVKKEAEKNKTKLVVLEDVDAWKGLKETAVEQEDWE